MNRFRAIPATTAIAALALFVATACNDTCNSTDAACTANADKGSKTFAVMMTVAPTNLGAIIFDVDGGGKKTLTLATDASVKGQAGANTGAISWRGVLLGRPAAMRIGTIVLDSATTVAPTVTVIEAAANASGNFMPIAANNITLVVQRLY